MSRTNELRLISRVAHMYHVEGIKQGDIAQALHISQATTSRLLKRAETDGIVRISINPPRGTYIELEAQIRDKFGIGEVIVAECYEDRDESIYSAIGVATAHLLETTLSDGDVIGVSSWSATLQEMLENLHELRRVKVERVVQLLGGIGVPSAQIHATQLTTRLAQLTGAVPQLLPSPCVTSSAQSKQIMIEDPQVLAAINQFERVTVALVGIGAMSPSANLIYSGNTFTPGELADLSARGAVGDICLRFYAEGGVPIEGEVYDRVVGMTLEQLRRVPRVIGTAGGMRKTAAIAGAMHGKLIDVLVTDKFTAQRLIEH